MRYIYLALFVLIASCVKPGMLYRFSTTDYTSIPDDLSENAKSIIRESNTELIIHDASKATFREQVAITILNEEHADFGIVSVPYDLLSKVEYLNARVINRRGEVVQTFNMGDALDFSQYDGVSFYSDNRIKFIKTFSSSYPYTVEFEYEKTLFGTLNLPTWIPVHPDQSVEKSTFTIHDFGTGVRTQAMNLKNKPISTQIAGGTKYQWILNDYQAKETEPYSPILENIPYLLVAPGKFEIGGSSGDASTWQSFGKWYYDLGAETRVLPDAAKKEIDNLVQGIENKEELVAILFKYLQEKNRYVSIQLGIGGWKPFTAEYVFNNSYGDCKALTNYMLAALEHVGIKADAVLINATSTRPLIEDFSGNQFNHVVLRVVLENGKEIWLECTSKYLPPNNLGNGYSKKALLVSKEGGEIVSTPFKNYTDNSKISIYTLVIDEQGNAELEGNLSFAGADQSSVLHQLLAVSKVEKMEWLENQLDGDSKKIRYADFDGVNSNSNEASILFKAELSNYASASSKRIFIPVNKLNRWRLSLEADNDRQLPVRFNYPFFESDSITIKIPDGYKIEAYPKASHLEIEFAEYHSELSLSGDETFTFKRSFKMKEREIAAENYDELRAFLNDVRKADLQQLVMVRSDSK